MQPWSKQELNIGLDSVTINQTIEKNNPERFENEAESILDGDKISDKYSQLIGASFFVDSKIEEDKPICSNDFSANLLEIEEQLEIPRRHENIPPIITCIPKKSSIYQQKSNPSDSSRSKGSMSSLLTRITVKHRNLDFIQNDEPPKKPKRQKTCDSNLIRAIQKRKIIKDRERNSHSGSSQHSSFKGRRNEKSILEWVPPQPEECP